MFSQKEFQKYAKDNLVLLKVDFPHEIKQIADRKKQNQKLAAQFQVRGFPTIVLLNAEGREIARTGYRKGGAAKYVEHLKELLDRK